MTFSPLAVRSPYGDGGQSDPRRGDCNYLQLHHGATTGADNLLRTLGGRTIRTVSSNYAGANGRLWGVASEDRRAYTSGSSIDHESITFEVQNSTANPDWLIGADTERAVIAGMAEIATRRSIPLRRSRRYGDPGVITHGDLYTSAFGYRSYATACPGGMRVDHMIREAAVLQASGGTAKGDLTVSDIKTIIAKLDDVRAQFRNLQAAPLLQWRDKDTGETFAVNPSTGRRYTIPDTAYRNLLVARGIVSDDVLNVGRNEIDYFTSLLAGLGTPSRIDHDKLGAALDALLNSGSEQASAEQPAPTGYVVKKGDTLWALAGGNADKVRAILAANPGMQAGALTIGSKITIPN